MNFRKRIWWRKLWWSFPQNGELKPWRSSPPSHFVSFIFHIFNFLFPATDVITYIKSLDISLYKNRRVLLQNPSKQTWKEFTALKYIQRPQARRTHILPQIDWYFSNGSSGLGSEEQASAVERLCYWLHERIRCDHQHRKYHKLESARKLKWCFG